MSTQPDLFEQFLSSEPGSILPHEGAPELTSTRLKKVSEEELSLLIKASGFKFKTRPRHHQLEAFLRSRDMDEYAFFMEMGTGKSKVGVDTAAYLYNTGKIDAVLIFSNKGSYRNWSDPDPEIGEIAKHMPEHVAYFMTYWDAGADKKLASTYDKLFEVTTDLKIFVMNIEALSYDKGTKVAARFVNCHKCLVIVDESTSIKNRDAKRTKNCIQLGHRAEYRRIMTGSPVTKSPMDLYAPCDFLNPALLGFSSYYSFQSRYADLIKREARVGNRKQTYTAITGYKHLDELQETLNKFSFRIRKDECLDLPEKIYQTYDVELTDEQVYHYKRLVEECMTEIKGELVSAPVMLTKLLRLHQLVCGYLVTDDKVAIPVVNNRLSALETIVEETDGKVIIWATYRKDIEAITDLLSKAYGSESVVSYYGDTSTNDRATAVRRFQDVSDPLRFFVGNPRVGGYGVTLTAAATVVYYSNNYDLEVRLQSEDRAHRIGQTKSVNYVDLVARKTVDEKIIRALRNKRDIAAEVLGDPNTFMEWLR